MDREETLVAQELATSSIYTSVMQAKARLKAMRGTLTGAIVEGVKEGKQGANGEDVVVLR
jgi:hypothetical protein